MNLNAFQEQLALFSFDASLILQQMVKQRGRLDPQQIAELKTLLSVSSDALLKTLLPLAAAMSTCPVSDFLVGAIAEGYREDGQGPWYFGANLEMVGQPLKMSIHAEQAAICNAWHQGESRLRRLMVNEAPCGHCRQFINEIQDVESLDIVISRLGSEIKNHYRISDLLPDSFGPVDLDQPERLLASSPQQFIAPEHSDKLVNAALTAASNSYAPYSGCYSGIALLLDNGDIVTGQYAENAAFNPSLTAIEAVLVNLRLNNLRKPEAKVVDAVLIEKETGISHKPMAQSVLDTVLDSNGVLRSFLV
ncbi:MAG: cytidine deaminase [Endozoicomonas sp.]